MYQRRSQIASLKTAIVMARILVSGLVNIETTLRVDAFPIQYSPVEYPFFGINSSVSGVGYNIAKALTYLGDDVSFVSLIGRDIAAQEVRVALAQDGIPEEYVLSAIDHTAQSVILFDREGRRRISVDLKDIQQRSYPSDHFERAAIGCDVFVLCNINFSRPFLRKMRETGKLIATDVHTISDLNDPYNADFMHVANILFMSDERFPDPPEAWARKVLDRYGPDILVIGLGAHGALLCVKADGFIERLPAVITRPIVNTIGAGDALFSAFVHKYLKSRDPYAAIQAAMVFASYKIGAISAADGYLDDRSLDDLVRNIHDRHSIDAET